MAQTACARGILPVLKRAAGQSRPCIWYTLIIQFIEVLSGYYYEKHRNQRRLFELFSLQRVAYKTLQLVNSPLGPDAPFYFGGYGAV